MQEAKKHTSLSRHIPRKQKSFSSYPSNMSHFIDDKTPCLRKATRKPVWPKAIKEEYQYTLRRYLRYYSRTKRRKIVVQHAANESIKEIQNVIYS
jgi:hypothetical protein